jgi:F-type H+-transporting ATPase subunit b
MDTAVFLAAGGVTEITQRFGLTLPHFVAQLLSFGIVCLLLHRYAYRRVLAVLEARREEIAQGLANAEKIKAELARTEAQRQEVLTQANAQATQLLAEAQATATRVQERETQKAIAAAEQIMAKAREAAAQDHVRMLAELKREVGQLVVRTTAAVTGKILTPEDQRRLAEDAAQQVRA